jgi:8-oxo-dGTP pyrophosphatase MutT (NUDIX family)
MQINEPISDALREQVIVALNHHPEWFSLREALVSRQGFVPWITMDQVRDVSSILCIEGDGEHDSDDDALPKGFQAYLEKRINPMIDRGEIEDGSRPGSFDDRKLRWADQMFGDLLSSDRSTLTLKISATCFPHCQRDIHRAPVDALHHMLAGIQDHNDPYAYFARGLGVVVIPLTRGGAVAIGQRMHTSEYKDLLCFVSGWASFSSNVKEIDFYQDVRRELEEELQLPSSYDINDIQFVGLSGEPLTGEADLVFITQTDLDEEHFIGSHCPEHSCWFFLRSRGEAQQLLEEGRLAGIDGKVSLVFSSQAGLDFLINSHWST